MTRQNTKNAQKRGQPHHRASHTTHHHYNTEAAFLSGTDIYDTEAEQFTHITLEYIVQAAANPRIGAKKTAPWFCPHDGKNKRTDGAQAAQFNAVLIDLDDGEWDAGRLLAALPCAFIAWTSSSHMQPTIDKKTGEVLPPAPRYKVLVPTPAPVTPEVWLKLAQGACIAFDADKHQAQITQVAYLPNKLTADAPYEHINVLDRQPLTADTAREWIALADMKAAAEKAAKQPQRTHTGSNANIINLANQAYDVRSLLEANGYLKAGKRYLSPQSQSGMAGVVILDDGRMYSHGSSDSLSDGNAHDAFDLLVHFRFCGDEKAAIRELANELDAEGQKQRQSEHAATRAQATSLASNWTEPAPFDFTKFAINNRIESMKIKMLKDVFILGFLAILGQLTAIYAKPNTGKTLITLKLLIDAVVGGLLRGEDVFYINADDTYRGLIHKAELVSKHGIQMIAPNENGFEVKHFTEYLNLMIRQDTARGKVIVLDTLKKFVDLMDKKLATEFMKTARAFVQAGGSMIMLAHTNKRRDGENKVIAGGTSDIIDDADCAYTLDEAESSSNEKTVFFENIKARGDVAKQAAYRYSTRKGMTYAELVQSVVYISDSEAGRAREAARKAKQREDDAEGIKAISQAVGRGHVKRTELIAEAMNASGISRTKITKILERYTSNNPLDFSVWRCIKGEDNASIYALHTQNQQKNEDTPPRVKNR